MPIFEFQCEECGKETERVVFGSETDDVTCPECGSDRMRKKMSVFASCGVGKDAGGACGPSSGFS